MSGHALFVGVVLTLAALAAVTMTLPTLALLYTLMSVEDSRR